MDLLAAAVEVVKQEPQMDVITVEIVQPDHIRIKTAHLFQETAGGRFRAEAGIVQEPSLQSVEPHFQLGANAHRGHIRAAAFIPAIGKEALVPLGNQSPALFRRDPPGAAVARHRVDKEIFHRLLFLLLIFS